MSLDIEFYQTMPFSCSTAHQTHQYAHSGLCKAGKAKEYGRAIKSTTVTSEQNNVNVRGKR